MMDIYKEQQVDEKGGDIILEDAKVFLQIPRGALTGSQLVSVEIKTGSNGISSGANPFTSVSPIVTCTTDGGTFQAPVTLRIPHCAVLDNVAIHEPRATYIKKEKSLDGDTVSIPCRLADFYCQISSTYLSNVEVILKDINKKKMQFVPFARRDNGVLVIRMWLINDLHSEHTLLLHQQEKLGFVMLGYGRFEMSRSGEFLLRVKLVDNQNNKMRRTKKIKNEMLFRRSKSCYLYQFEIQKNVAPREINIKLFQSWDEDNAYRLRKTFDEALLLALQGDQEEMNDETVTIADTLAYCEELSTALLTWTFSKLKKEFLFPSETISSLNKTADELERRKNVKSSTVIGGSSAGIVGGALAMTGAALIPISCGASVGLIAAGATLGVAGSGLGIAFSIGKVVNDERSKKEIKIKLQEFQLFQKNFMTALSNLILTKDAIERLQRLLSFKEKNKTLSDVDTIKHIKNLIKSHDIQNHRFPIDSIPEILSEIICQSEHVIEGLCIIEEMFELDLIGNRETSLQSMLGYKDVIYAFGLTYESNGNFLAFAIEYLKLDTIPAADIILPAAMLVEAGSNTVVRGGATAYQVAAKVGAGVAEVSDDVFQISSGVAKVAKGFTTACFVLGGIGIAAEAAFLGYAIFELVQKAELSEGLRAVCDLMKTINHWQNLESS